MRIKEFLKLDWKKLLLSIFIAYFLLDLGTISCIDPSLEGWTKHPDPEYWGCHTQLHRYFHFIPEMFILNWFIIFPPNPFLNFLGSILTSFLFLTLSLWKSKEKNIR